ncbi:hypothetical protein JXM67_14485 [candidate division WOR-3 bacterium]|nr:hypothetical protein [candidate division WOR-3 bacterium]
MNRVIALLAIMSCVAFAGVAFGVNPISTMPESYIGYKIGPVVPYLSLNFFNAGGHVFLKEEGYRDYRDPPNYEYGDTVTWSGSVLAPCLGTKIVFGDSELKPFLRLSAGMPFILTWNVEVNLDDDDMEEDVEEIIADARDGLKNPFIVTGGAGVECLLTDRFSIGGEFLYRYVTSGFNYEYYYEYSGGDWYRDEVEIQANFGGTSAGLWLNFYF